MPSLEDIERFRTVLRSVGGEMENPEEDYEDEQEIGEAEEAAVPDLSALLGTSFDSEEQPAGEAEEGFAEEGFEELPEMDFDSLLGEADEASGDETPGEEEQPPSVEEELLEIGEGEFEVGEEDADEVSADEASADEASGDEASVEGEGELSFAEEFQLPDFEDDFGAETEDADAASVADETSADETSGDEVPAEEEFSLPEEFFGETPAVEESPSEPTNADPEGGAEEEAEFELPEGFGFETPVEEQPPETEEADETSGDETSGDETSGDETSGDGTLGDGELGEGALPGEEEFLIDEFTLPDLGEDFAAPAAEEEAEEDAFAPPTEPAAEAGAEQEFPEITSELEGAEEEFELRDEEFQHLQRTLDSLPRNLKIIVEELVAEKKVTGGELRSLIDALVGGASPTEIAALVSRITRKKITIPRSFERKKGVVFEREKRTLGYVLRENIAPIVASVGVVALVLSLLAFLAYRFIYVPINAAGLYRHGYAELAADRYDAAESSFGAAVGQWPVKNWYYRYAEAYAEKRQFGLATEKYDHFLGRYPGDRKGTLDYARLESEHLANYEKAEMLLNGLLEDDMYDLEALLASGDNYMRWAEIDPTRYEDARFSYGTVINRYGPIDEALFRMLRYFVKTDKLSDAEDLYLRFKERSNVDVEPLAYAELGGFFLDKNRMEHVEDVLFSALDVREDIPELHYNLARFYRRMGDPIEEKKALYKTLEHMGPSDVPNGSKTSMIVDTHARLGQWFYANSEYLSAEEEFQKASNLLEEAQRRKVLGRDPMYGRVYHDWGNIYYYVDGDLDRARALFQKAESYGYDEPEIGYQMGYIAYAEGDFREALLRFVGIESLIPSNENVLYAAGNALFKRGDYSAAQGYYLHLLKLLETRRENLPFVDPVNYPEHRALLDYLIRTLNNTGVTFAKLSETTGDRAKLSEGMSHLAFSSEHYDALARETETLVRTDTRNLAYLNTRGLLYPDVPFELQIYSTIPKDTSAQLF